MRGSVCEGSGAHGGAWGPCPATPQAYHGPRSSELSYQEGGGASGRWLPELAGGSRASGSWSSERAPDELSKPTSLNRSEASVAGDVRRKPPLMFALRLCVAKCNCRGMPRVIPALWVALWRLRCHNPGSVVTTALS